MLDPFRQPPQKGEGFDFLSGESLLDLLMPPGYKPAEKDRVDMTSGPNNSERQVFIENQKLVTSSGRALGLYDLENDAAEKNDLMESDPERGTAVLDRFKAFRRSLREVKVREKPD